MINITFFTISTDLSMKNKREIHMKIDAPWSLLSEVWLFFLPLFIKVHGISESWKTIKDFFWQDKIFRKHYAYKGC